MLPVIQLGPWEIRTYGLILSLAAVVVGMVGFHRLRRLGLPPDTILRAGLPVLVAGFGGAFLPPLLFGQKGLLAAIPLRYDAGPTIGWGAACAIAVGIIQCWRLRVPLARAFDLGVLGCPLGQAIGRLGCLAAGCCAGKATTSLLGVYMPGAGGVWAVRYPAPLLDGGAHALMFLALVAVENWAQCRPRREGENGAVAWPFDGFLFLLYLLLSSLVRLGMAFLREGVTPVIGPLGMMHLQGIGGATLAVVLLLWNVRHHL